MWPLYKMSVVLLKVLNKPCFSVGHPGRVQINSCLTLLACDVIASRGTASGRAEGTGYIWECKSELMKLPQALFSYTKNLMTSFLTGHSGPGGGEDISKPAQVCVVSENMVHGRGQSLALSWQLLKIGFPRRTHSAHLCWSLLWWHCETPHSSVDGRYPI